MREIKFRAWDSREKKMIYNGYWESGCTHIKINFDGTIQGFSDNDDGTAGLWEHDVDIRGERLILLQFTGLHDKNGKEIYEGDTVKDICLDMFKIDRGDIYIVKQGEYDDSEIEWGSPGIGWFGEALHKRNDLDPRYPEQCSLVNFHELMIIGNIYENPELLK